MENLFLQTTETSQRDRWCEQRIVKVRDKNSVVKLKPSKMGTPHRHFTMDVNTFLRSISTMKPIVHCGSFVNNYRAMLKSKGGII